MEQNLQRPTKDLKTFFKACDEFTNGRFILADVKISKILRAVANSKEIYNLLAECLINFDFEREFSKCRVQSATGGIAFRLPAELHKLVPLVFCLLVDFDSKKLDFNYFLKTQFPLASSQQEEYQMFSDNVVTPFKKAIAELFNVTTDVDDEEELSVINTEYEELATPDGNVIISKTTTAIDEEAMEEDEVEDSDEEEQTVVAENEEELFGQIMEQVYEIDDRTLFVRNSYKRGNLRLILKAIEEACNLENLTIISALIYSLNELGRGEKSIRDNIKEINDIFYKFFN